MNECVRFSLQVLSKSKVSEREREVTASVGGRQHCYVGDTPHPDIMSPDYTHCKPDNFTKLYVTSSSYTDILAQAGFTRHN
ncbi:hypothetical protein ACOMHN_036680 [Nucella lapillus]